MRPYIFVLFLLLSQHMHAKQTFSSVPANFIHVNSLLKKVNILSVKGEKIYCSPTGKTKYKLLITGSTIKITRLYQQYVDIYNGTLKNGKIYTNDPEEKRSKVIWGKFYKLQGTNFGVLNIANGDYEWYKLCK